MVSSLNLTGLAWMDGSHRSTTDNQYANITAATTTVVKSGAGLLHLILVAQASASGGTISIYDNTTGSGPSICVLGTTTQGANTFNVNFNTGLTIVSTSTLNAMVAYK